MEHVSAMPRSAADQAESLCKVTLQWGHYLHPESLKSKLFLFPLSSKFCHWWFCQQQEFYQPLPTQLSSFARLPVLARVTQVCTKTWQLILLIYLQLLLFIDSFPYWNKLWASLSQWEFCLFLSSGQDFLCHLQIPSWTCSPFYHLCLLWNLLPILLKYSFFFFQCPSS